MSKTFDVSNSTSAYQIWFYYFELSMDTSSGCKDIGILKIRVCGKVSIPLLDFYIQ